MNGLLEELDKNFWEWYPRLVKCAEKIARRKLWQGQRYGNMPRCQEVEDIVFGAVEKLKSGARTWNPQEHPSLLECLCGIIKSEISNLSQLKANEIIEKSMDGDPGFEGLANRTTASKNPLGQLIRNEEQKAGNAAFDRLLAMLDDEETQILDCILDEVIWPREMSVRLGWEISKVNVVQKRYRRKIRKFKESEKAGLAQGGQDE